MKIQDGQTLGDFWYQLCIESRKMVASREKTIRKLKAIEHDVIHDLMINEKTWYWSCDTCDIHVNEKMTIEELLEVCPS